MKRVLIVSYHWPPAGGVTVLRTLRFASRLREHGWEPVIATATPDAYETYDHALAAEVPAGLEVLRIPAWNPYHLYKSWTRSTENAEEAIASARTGGRQKLALWVRANGFIPDAKAPWIRPTLKRLEAYLKDRPVDALFTSGPPHTNTEVASRLKDRLGIAWLADFQDPWAQLGYFGRLPLTRFARGRHERLEALALSRADAVTVASPTWRLELEARGARSPEFLPWGFEEAEFTDEGEAPETTGMRLCHLGTMGADRDPTPVLDALADFPKPWTLEVAGTFTAAARHPRLVLHGFLPRAEALKLLRNSQVALLFLNQLDGQKGRIPAKLYEYLRSGKPILALGDPEGDAARLISDFGAGLTVPAGDLPGVRAAWETLIDRPRGADPAQLGSFGLRHLTARVAATLSRIATGS